MLLAASNILALLTKLAEAVPVASIAFIGRFNGSKDFARCGEYLYNTFWITFVLSLSQFLIILFGARSIFAWLEASPKIIEIAVPFIQLKSLGIILIFSVMVFMGFMRAVKNTYMPMFLNISGTFDILTDLVRRKGDWPIAPARVIGRIWSHLRGHGL